ncbi:MAG: amidohydrolase family protein [Myxococcales bacterium]|nr:amidohydrolase family protein [Myxococcales bacterium]
MSASLTRRALLGGITAGLLPHLALPHLAHAQPQGAFAIRGASFWRPGQAPLADAVIVVKDGKIAYAGDDASQASGARTLTQPGGVVMAGMTDLITQVGLVEVDLEPSSRDDSHDADDPIRAAFRAADGFDHASSVVAITRAAGVTSVGVVPAGGLVAGQSAWADLGDQPKRAIARERLALHVRMSDGSDFGAGSYEASSGAILLRLRELFDDARTYRKNKGGFDRRQVRELGASRLDLEVIVDVLERRLPIVVHVDRASDIASVLRFLDEQKDGNQRLRAAIASGAEAWKVADALAEAEVAAIVYPLDHGPRSFEARYAREDNAAGLNTAGVRLALSTGETHNARKLAQEAGNAIRAGLPTPAAVAAVTSTPAAIMGMAEHGTLDEGRQANLVVWSGDPFEISSKVELLVIHGRAVSLRTRQTALFERYR